ncbi:MAG: helix-turn-helix domain-containing protein [Deltaproteobacteria bacterium]|nr:helix-turn-helix domain-containing protein [Deltaproteobacteria bacterium]
MKEKPLYEELEQRVNELEKEAKRLRQKEKALKKQVEELEVKADSREQSNKALRILLKQRDEDRDGIEEKVVANVRELVMPFLRNLKESKLNAQQKINLDVIEGNLNSIISPFSRTISTKYLSLTPQEIQIAVLIKEGKSNREIADVMNLSRRTIESHREHMRRKMGLKHKRANLRAHLLALV